MSSGHDFWLHFAAGATGVACILFGVTVLAMQAGRAIAGGFRQNAAEILVRAVFGVAMGTLGCDLLILVMK